MVSLFDDNESQYLRYSAAVAATEPLRADRDNLAKAAMPSFRYFLLKKQKRNVCESDPYGRNVALQRVCSSHVAAVSKIIKSLGLSVSEFNALSRRVSTDPALRDRVMRQVNW